MDGTTRVSHSMTNEQVAATPVGTTLHYTNWPGVPSVPVELLDGGGKVLLPNGNELYAFADELSREPRTGLGE
jgi:hypothetical protein